MLTFKIEKDENKWHAFCPELPWCHTFGDTQELALTNLKNAISLYIEDEIENQSFNDIINQDKDLKYA